MLVYFRKVKNQRTFLKFYFQLYSFGKVVQAMTCMHFREMILQGNEPDYSWLNQFLKDTISLQVSKLNHTFVWLLAKAFAENDSKLIGSNINQKGQEVDPLHELTVKRSSGDFLLSDIKVSKNISLCSGTEVRARRLVVTLHIQFINRRRL